MRIDFAGNIFGIIKLTWSLVAHSTHRSTGIQHCISCASCAKNYSHIPAAEDHRKHLEQMCIRTNASASATLIEHSPPTMQVDPSLVEKCAFRFQKSEEAISLERKAHVEWCKSLLQILRHKAVRCTQLSFIRNLCSASDWSSRKRHIFLLMNWITACFTTTELYVTVRAHHALNKLSWVSYRLPATLVLSRRFQNQSGGPYKKLRLEGMF